MTAEKNLDDYIIWLNALELERTTTAETLFTGRSIAEALHKIDPCFFDEKFLDRIPVYDPEVNWHMKKNNLHKIYLHLSEFYKDRLKATLTEKWIIDFRNEGEETITSAVICLMKLVLAASLLHKLDLNYFINLMMKQSTNLQLIAVGVLQEIYDLLPQSSGTVEDEGSSTAALGSLSSGKKLEELKGEVEQLSREKQRLLQQAKEIKEERDQLVEQNKSLRSELEDLGGSSSEAENLRKQLRATNTMKESIQDSLYKVEAERDHYRKSAEEVAKENMTLVEKLQSLAPLEEECRKAKDEVEEFRLRTLDFDKLNSQVETYKAKLKDYNAQKIEMKVLEEKVSTYMQSVIALEDEQRKNGALKTQIESLRLENHDLSKKLREEVLRGDKAEFEIKRLSDRLKAAESAKDQLREEYRQLNEKVLLRGEILLSKASLSSLHDETMEADGFSLQERVLRLEKEKEILQAKESEQINLIREEMNVMAEKKAEIESELNWSQRRIMELEAKLKDAEESITKGEGLNENRFSEQQALKEKLALNVAQLEARLELANKNNESIAEEKEKLKEELEAAKRDLMAEKENLRIYMEKARRVIDDVEKQNRAVEAGGLSRHEFDAIRRERDSYKQMVENLREKFEKSRTMQEEEQRLITSNFYYMMMQKQHSSRLDDSTRSDVLSTPEKSFLARQRQCCNFSR